MRITSKSAGLVSLMRLRETSLEALQFCCSIRIAGVVCSVMGRWGGGGSYDVETEGGRLGMRGRGGRARVGGGGRLVALSGTCAKGVGKGKRGVRLIVPSTISDTASLSCECGFGGWATADPAGVIALAVSTHSRFYAAALTIGTGVLMGAFTASGDSKYNPRILIDWQTALGRCWGSGGSFYTARWCYSQLSGEWGRGRPPVQYV